MAEPLIQFKNLRKRFGDNVVLDGVDLEFFEGQVTTIIGKSGAGKSVMIKHIVGLLAPDSGEILVRGRPLSAMDREERRAFKSRVSYMFQSNALFDSMNVFDNVALPLRERRKTPEAKIREKVMGLLEILELPAAADRYPSQLSGGMQKRVALARALVSDPEIVLFDEPTTGLDPLRKNSVLAMVGHYQRRFGFTAIMVSHDVPDVFYISNRIAILDKGKILFQGSPVELERSGNEVAAEFLASLENLENDLVGLMGPHALSAALADESGPARPAVLLSLSDVAALRSEIGDLATHRVLDTLAALVRDKGGEGALLGRTGPGEILCVLPTGGDATRFLDAVGAALGNGEAVCRFGAEGLSASPGVLGAPADISRGCIEAAAAARASVHELGRMRCGDGES